MSVTIVTLFYFDKDMSTCHLHLQVLTYTTYSFPTYILKPGWNNSRFLLLFVRVVFNDPRLGSHSVSRLHEEPPFPVTSRAV